MTLTERLQRELAAFAALINCASAAQESTLRTALQRCEGEVQNTLATFTDACRAAHVPAGDYVYDCTFCEAIRDAETAAARAATYVARAKLIAKDIETGDAKSAAAYGESSAATEAAANAAREGQVATLLTLL
jgi:hypothetical protein